MTAPTSGRVARRAAREAEHQRVVVFACGDPLRGDDAAGPRAVAGLAPDVVDGADVRVVGALEAEYLIDLPAGSPIVIVDAVVGVAPGRIIEMDLAALATRASPVVTTSTHQLPLDEVVALAQLLRDEPLRGRLVGVGIETVAEGVALSRAVETALPELRLAVSRAIDDLSSHPRG